MTLLASRFSSISTVVSPGRRQFTDFFRLRDASFAMMFD
jgi:hypothetical protein